MSVVVSVTPVQNEADDVILHVINFRDVSALKPPPTDLTINGVIDPRRISKTV
jgi:hypothetical protein